VSKNIVHSFLWRMVISIKMAPSTGSAWSRRTTCVQFTGLGDSMFAVCAWFLFVTGINSCKSLPGKTHLRNDN